VNRNEIVTDYVAKVGDRLIASGRQWQKIIAKDKLARLFDSLQ